jgi:hypothetical protein
MGPIPIGSAFFVADAENAVFVQFTPILQKRL